MHDNEVILQNQAIYEEHGCEDRNQYLEQLAEEYDTPLNTVKSMASILGPTEDFDGLVSELQNYSGLI